MTRPSETQLDRIEREITRLHTRFDAVERFLNSVKTMGVGNLLKGGILGGRTK